jgi:uncharacterized coiled-coil protein SlyX
MNDSVTQDELDSDRKVRGRRPHPDFRDLAIEELSDSEAELLERLTILQGRIAELEFQLAERDERIAWLEADVAAYRCVSQQGIHALHVVVAERDRFRERLRALTEEFRSFRAGVITEPSRKAVA